MVWHSSARPGAEFAIGGWAYVGLIFCGAALAHAHAKYTDRWTVSRIAVVLQVLLILPAGAMALVFGLSMRGLSYSV
jgi:hypothetical protein